MHYCFQIRCPIHYQALIVSCMLIASIHGEELPEKLKSWLGSQSWERDTDGPILSLGETGRFDDTHIFAPVVIRGNNRYLMWYGSYWTGRSSATATGFAVSLDGLKWYKHPCNPVLRPDPNRQWESHYVTSQSVMRLPDGRFRIWYASRKKPPSVNKYFALNTAVWQPTEKEPPPETDASISAAAAGPQAFCQWRNQQRRRLRKMLGIPEKRVPLDAERRGELEWDGIVIEKWVFTSEPGSRVPTVLYRPKRPAERSRTHENSEKLPANSHSLTTSATREKMPAIVLTFGHGGSKHQWQYNYGGLVYAKLGLACLAMDPLGEEERHRDGRLGTRAHDPKAVSDRADKAAWVIDKGDDSVWKRMRQVVSRASNVYKELGSPGGIRAWYESEGSHRPYFVYKQSLEWIHQHLGTPSMTLQQIRKLPTVNSGEGATGRASSWNVFTERRCINAVRRCRIWVCIPRHVKSYRALSPMNSARPNSRWEAGCGKLRVKRNECINREHDFLSAPHLDVYRYHREFAAVWIRPRDRHRVIFFCCRRLAI